MVGLDGVDDLFLLLVLPGEFHAQLHMGALHLMIDGLAQIVKQTGPLGSLHIGTQLGGHHAGNVGHLDGVLQNVLAIAGAVMETAQHLHQLGVEVADAALEHGALALGLDGGLHLTAGLLHHFLDMGGMDTAVSDQLFQCQPGDLPADRLEAGDGDGLRCIVDDEIHTGQSLDGTDVAALAADDTALHLVIGQGNHTDGQLGHGVRRAALDGLSHHFAGAGLAFLFHPGLHLFDLEGSLVGHFALHLLNEVFLGLVSGKAGDLFQHSRLALLDGADLLLFLLHGRVLLGQRFFLLLNGLQLAVQIFFLLLQTVFLPLQIGSAGLFFLLVISTAFQDLLLGFQQRFLLFALGVADCFVDDAPAFFFGAGDLFFRYFFAIKEATCKAAG